MVIPMEHVKLSEKQRKEFLKSFREIDIQKELKILFEKMKKSSVHILQGTEEFGKDLIIKDVDPMATRYISVVVKMGDISGAAKDTTLNVIKNQVEQSFEIPFSIPDELGEKKINEVYVILFGMFSNNAQKNIDIFLGKNSKYSGRVTLFDISDMDKFFCDYYPEIYCGASGFEALSKKDKELELILLQKDRTIANSFIEPSLKKFVSNDKKEICTNSISDAKQLKKTITESLIGIDESIDSLIDKIQTAVPRNILIEGDAGSGKSVFAIKVAQRIIEKSIFELNVSKKRNNDKKINAPAYISALSINGKNLEDIIREYYIDSTYNFRINVLIIDGLDEVSQEKRKKLIDNCISYCKNTNTSLIFTCRKNYNLATELQGFIHYEIRAFETAQAINYIKKLAAQNNILLDSLLKSIKQIEHQIPLYPMALSLLVEIVRKHNEVPASISELYSRYINIALGEKDSIKGIEVLFEYRIKKNFLIDVSYNLFFTKDRVIIDYHEFVDFTVKYVTQHKHISSAENFINEIKRSSLLIFSDDKVFFLHKSFLDYFTAEYFSLNRDDLSDSGKFEDIYSLFYSNYWEDVLLFFFGIKTKITKSAIEKIIRIGNEKIIKSDSIMLRINLFMLGKLMQYAWDSSSEAKSIAINNAMSVVLDTRNSVATLLKEQSKISNLPAIIYDTATLHLFDLSYSSNFLRNEIQSIVESRLNNIKQQSDISNDEIKSVLYFSSLFMITNIKQLDKNFIDGFLNKFLEIESSLNDKYIIAPLIGLFKFILNGRIEHLGEDNYESINKVYKKLMKKHKSLMQKTFFIINKNEQPYYRTLAHKK